MRNSSEGTLDFPFCGRIQAAGLRSTTLADRLTACLKGSYLEHPQVTVFLKEYNSKKIFVFGEVQKPGTFPFDDHMSIVQALTMAEGFNKLAAKNSVIVARVADGQEQKIKVPVENVGKGGTRTSPWSPAASSTSRESFL